MPLSFAFPFYKIARQEHEKLAVAPSRCGAVHFLFRRVYVIPLSWKREAMPRILAEAPGVLGPSGLESTQFVFPAHLPHGPRTLTRVRTRGSTSFARENKNLQAALSAFAHVCAYVCVKNIAQTTARLWRRSYRTSSRIDIRCEPSRERSFSVFFFFLFSKRRGGKIYRNRRFGILKFL